LTDEKPTPQPEGASITDRLEKFLSAEDSPAQETQKPAATQEAATDADPANQAETKPATPDSDAPGEDKQPQLSTSDLAKVFGVDDTTFDVDADGNVVVKLKADGKELAPKLADLIQSYQVKGYADNKAREVAEQSKALQQRAQEAEQQLQQRLGHAEQLANIAAQELMAEYQQYDWKALDQHPDQGAVAALKLKFQERNQKIQQAMQGINAQRGQLHQQAQAQQAARVQAEAAKLPTLIPEWKDNTVAAKESKELVDWGRSVGYSDAELSALNNSSALHVATTRKAMLYDKLQQSKAVVENKVRLAPKIVKPGQAQTNSAADSDRALKQNFVKAGGKNGTLEALLIARGFA
jgi:hypothetical protein